MKKVLGAIAGIVFGLFGIGVIGLMVSLTFAALGRIFPGSFENQLWGLVIYDIATIAWALAFVFKSNSLGQYAAAGSGFLVGLVGTLGMIAAEVILSGQSLTGGTTDSSEIGRWMIYAFIGCTAIHVCLIYAHHGSSPEIAQQISTGVERGLIRDKAMKDAEKQLEAERPILARDITADIVAQVRRDMQLPIPAHGTIFEPAPRVPDEVKAMYAPGTQFIDGTSNPQPGAPDNYGPLWKSSTDITPTLDAYAWVCDCSSHNDPYTRNCQMCGNPRTNGSPVTAFGAAQPAKEAGIKPSPFLKSEPDSETG